MKPAAASGNKKGPTPREPNKANEEEVDPFDSDLDLTSPIPPGGFKGFHKPLNKSATDLKVLGVKGIEMAANLDKAGTVTPSAFEGFMISFQHLALTRGNGQVLTTRSLNGQILIVARDMAAVPVITGWVKEIKWTDPETGKVHGFRAGLSSLVRRPPPPPRFNYWFLLPAYSLPFEREQLRALCDRMRGCGLNSEMPSTRHWALVSVAQSYGPDLQTVRGLKVMVSVDQVYHDWLQARHKQWVFYGGINPLVFTLVLRREREQGGDGADGGGGTV